MKISVILPTFNEGLAMKDNISRATNYLDTLSVLSWELILVNDGSTDNTLSIMREAQIVEPRIKIVSHSKNRGRGYALRAGLASANGEIVISTESDLNWGTDIIGRFIDELKDESIDMVIASPHMKGGFMENVPFSRWLVSYLGNIIFNFALPGNITMSTGMTRGYKRHVIDSLDLESDQKEIHVEILYKAIDLGYRVKEIPGFIKWAKPKLGEKVRKSNFKWGFMLKHLLLGFAIRPFMLFGGIGSLMILLGVIFGLWLLYLSLTGTAVAGRPLISFAVLLLVVGFQILVFGFLASQNRELKKQLVRMQAEWKRKIIKN